MEVKAIMKEACQMAALSLVYGSIGYLGAHALTLYTPLSASATGAAIFSGSQAVFGKVADLTIRHFDSHWKALKDEIGEDLLFLGAIAGIVVISGAASYAAGHPVGIITAIALEIILLATVLFGALAIGFGIKKAGSSDAGRR